MMKPEEIIEKYVWLVLQNIKRESLIADGNLEYIIKDYSDGDLLLTKETHIKILRKLADREVIYTWGNPLNILNDQDLPIKCFIEINNDRFYTIYKKYEKKIENLQTLAVPIDGLLRFYPAEGIIEYKGYRAKFKQGKKVYELLNFLNNNKDNPLKLKEIVAECNKNIPIIKHHFKGDKDIMDTIRSIKQKLKVRKGEFFPIQNRQFGWTWVER